MTSAGVSWPVSWVGVAGFEPAASSSRTKADLQAVTSATLLTCAGTLHDAPASPIIIASADARLTHGSPLTQRPRRGVSAPGGA